MRSVLPWLTLALCAPLAGCADLTSSEPFHVIKDSAVAPPPAAVQLPAQLPTRGANGKPGGVVTGSGARGVARPPSGSG